jgi:hypothetical protein
MTSHLVLFRLSRTLSDADRDAFVGAIETALTDIPTIRRATVGRRIRLGAAYDSGTEHYDYMAVLEFDDEAGLRGYLEHPLHADLGARFFASSEATLVYDFETVPGDRLRELTDI